MREPTKGRRGRNRAERVLIEHGFELVPLDGLPAPQPELTRYWASRVVPESAARGRIAGKEVHCRVVLGLGTRSSGRVLVVSVPAPAVDGHASLRTVGRRGFVHMLGDLPAPLRILLTVLLVVGVWAILLPGMMFYSWLGRRRLQRMGFGRFPELAVSPRFAREFDLWGPSRAQVEQAFPHSFQQAVLDSGYWGVITASPGELAVEFTFPTFGMKPMERFLSEVLPKIVAA